MVGLGNPGARYDDTRHNLGAAAAVLLADRNGARLRDDPKVSASVAEIRIGGKRVVVAVPLTYMNDSGRAVRSLLTRYDVDGPENLVVMHDELDLPPGRVKIKSGGGIAGHNGLRSIRQHLSTEAFTRVRLGVGKPPGGSERGADWVLSKIPRAARPQFDAACERALEAVELIATGGIQHAMARINAAETP